MNKKDVLEIRKLYAKDVSNVRKMVGCYVDAEKNIKATFSKTFLNLDDVEMFKYLEIFKKGLTGDIGKNIRTFNFPNENSMKDSLLKLRSSELKDDAILDSFYRKIIDTYNFVENYVIILINNTYDVIRKGKDGSKQESEEIYDYISCYICPVKLEKPGLIYNEMGNSFESKDRRWCIDAPVCNFLYPSFEGRSEDANCITVYTKKTDSTYSEFIEGFLELELNLSPEEQKKGFQLMVENVLKGNSDKMEVVKAIQEIINDKIEDSDTTLELGKEEVKHILTESGISDNALNDFDINYSEKFGNRKISAGSIVDTKKLEVKAPDIIVKVKPEKSQLVQSKTIDGKKCLVIDIGSNSDVEVNGINL